MPMYSDILKELRRDRHITQRQMGELLGISQSSYSDYENATAEYAPDHAGFSGRRPGHLHRLYPGAHRHHKAVPQAEPRQFTQMIHTPPAGGPHGAGPLPPLHDRNWDQTGQFRDTLEAGRRSGPAAQPAGGEDRRACQKKRGGSAPMNTQQAVARRSLTAVPGIRPVPQRSAQSGRGLSVHREEHF